MRPDWLEKKIASHASLDGYVKPKAGDLLRLDSNENLVIPKNYIWNLFEQNLALTSRCFAIDMSFSSCQRVLTHVSIRALLK